MIHPSRRTPRRARPQVHGAIRVRSSGFGLLTGAAVAGVLAFALGGEPVALTARADPATRTSAIGAAPASGVPASVVPASIAPESDVPASSAAASGAPPKAALIPEVPWLVQRPDGGWVHGRGAGSRPRRLPVDETGIAVSEQWVASVVPTADGRSAVRFRDRETGRAVTDVQATIWVSAGAWSSAGLVVTGYGDRSMTTDGGLVLVSPVTMTARALVGAGPFDARLGLPVARGDVVVSPSGQRVASNACGIDLCDTQVVDVTSGATSRPLQAAEGFLRVLTEDAIVTTDGDARWISARRIADGTEIWRRHDSVLLDPVATADGSVVALMGSRKSGWGIAAIDARGGVRDLGPRADGRVWPRIWTALSGPSTVVVAGEAFAEWIGTGGSASVTVLGVDGPRTTSVASRVRLPAASEWLR